MTGSTRNAAGVVALGIGGSTANAAPFAAARQLDGSISSGVPARAETATAMRGSTERQEARLWRNGAALRVLRGWGLRDETIRRFRLGLKEPYLSRTSGLLTDGALVFPLIGADGPVANRYAYLNIDGFTANPGHPISWGPGRPTTNFSRQPFASAPLLLVDSPILMWQLSQALDEAGAPMVVAVRSHSEGDPLEWSFEAAWSGWSRVILVLDGSVRSDGVGRLVAAHAPQHLLSVPPDDVVALSARLRKGMSNADLRGVIAAASEWTPAAVRTMGSGLNHVAAVPFAVDGAYHRGRMYYPVTMEQLEEVGGPVPVSSYVVKVVRSDGMLLDVAVLPHPPSTPVERRVVALSDGTRITEAPRPSSHGSWGFASIASFIEARRGGGEPERRALAEIISDVERCIRAAVWLPDPNAYAGLALYIAASYVHRVFDAMALLLLNGPKASGKSELGSLVAALGFNGVSVGQLSGAGLIRLIDETRGLLVIDDLEAIAGSGSAAAEIGQVLKCSYKQSTARKPIPGRGGKVRIYDFYGPKVDTNIGGTDAVLGSRMLTVRTSPGAPDAASEDHPADLLSHQDLRDELHVWSMCQASEVERIYRALDHPILDRASEIAAPLRAVARLADDTLLADRLEQWLKGPRTTPGSVRTPDEQLVAALAAIAARGAGSTVSLAQIQLELALASVGHAPPVEVLPAETIGRRLLAIGARQPDAPVERRRLHGVITRMYAISDRLGGSAEGSEPLAFCEAAVCSSCPYGDVCAAAVPSLKTAKERRAVQPDL